MLPAEIRAGVANITVLGNFICLSQFFRRRVDSDSASHLWPATIREEWFNGKAYYRLHGQRLANVPSEPAHLPDSDFLRWHNENCFQG